jgi:fructose-1,6-bisphosphatase/inositol monophosphatase family enzyme
VPSDPEPIGPAAILPASILPASILARAIDAAVEAGHLVAAEFARPDGPRFSDNVTAPLDREIEMLLRDRLLALVPARFVGEEAGVLEAPDSPLANGFCWVVDPHDGTRAFLEGKRGSAVSVALLRQGIPILAVVYAPTSPDRGPDLIAWAEGGPITRDGVPVTIDLRERDLAAGDVVFLNHGAWQRPVWHGGACAPAGFMPLPSIAYRLARIAVGDGIATLTLRPVNALDIAAGHALLMAAGGVLLAEDGTPVTYNDLGESRPSACFGGAPKAVAALRARTWRGSQEPRREPRVTLTWPRWVPEAMLDRAAGCLFGLAIGGDLGAETELAVIVARALLGHSTYDRAAVDAAVRDWADAGGDLTATSPFARAIPIGIWAFDPDMAAAAAGLDSPEEPRCADLAALIAAAIGGAAAEELALRRDALTGEAEGTLYPPATGASSAAVVLSPAITGAIDGAIGGRRAFPTAQVMRILTWRPDARLAVARPRPEICWTDDLVDLAEALLCQGQRGQGQCAREPA